MLFNFFPKTTFKISDTEHIVVTDFIRAIKIPDTIKNNSLYFKEYVAADNETPEIISHKMYGTTTYHWVIMLINEKYDVRNDFPLDDISLQKICIDTYGDLDVIHHYEDSNGNIVDEFTSGKMPITNIEHIRKQNDSKRYIKVLDFVVLTDFVSQYKSLIKV